MFLPHGLEQLTSYLWTTVSPFVGGGGDALLCLIVELGTGEEELGVH